MTISIMAQSNLKLLNKEEKNMISMIAAIGQNNELGKDNKLIWHLKGDMQSFKNLTMHKKIVMGANTYRSLPQRLENREYLVLSKSIKEIPYGTLYHDFTKLLNYLKTLDEEVMVIGGSKLYEAFLPYAERLYLTEIKAESPADAYFPNFAKTNYKRRVLVKNQENGISYEIVLYEKKGELK